MPKNSSKSNPKIAIIGGSGLEDPKFFKKIKEIKMKTEINEPKIITEALVNNLLKNDKFTFQEKYKICLNLKQFDKAKEYLQKIKELK